MARVESRWSHEEMRGARLVCGERYCLPGGRSRRWGEAEAVLVASVGCVKERSFEMFVFSKVLGGGRCRAWVPRGRRRRPGNPRLQESCLSHVESRRQQVGHGWLDEEDRLTPDKVGAGLRLLSEERSPASWAAGVIAKAIEDLPTQGHCESWSKKGRATPPEYPSTVYFCRRNSEKKL